MNEETARQNRVAGFLLGLGFGLVAGIIFQPRAAQAWPLAECDKSLSRETGDTGDQGIPES
jgi:hypothetical protein